MGLRFRRIFRIAPGVKINLSKTGTSLSLGKSGATVNFGRKRARATVGLPGSGVSYSEDVAYAGGRRASGSGLTRFLLLVLAGLAFAGFQYLTK